MRTKSIICLLAVFVIGFSAVSVMGQEQEENTQLFLIEDFTVYPSKVNEFKDNVKQILDLYKQYKYPYACFVHASMDNHVYLGYPINDLSDIGEFTTAWMNIVKQYGMDSWLSEWKQMGENIESFQMYVLENYPSLSYVPKNQDEEQRGTWYWGQWYLKVGHEHEAMAIRKEFTELYKRKNMPVFSDFWMGSVGTDLSLYNFFYRGTDEVDVWTQWSKVQELGGEETKALVNRIQKISRKYDFKMGRRLPELTYIPEQGTN
jgi:hypothetical protein